MVAPIDGAKYEVITIGGNPNRWHSQLSSKDNNHMRCDG